jgi:hypothetical protein
VTASSWGRGCNQHADSIWREADGERVDFVGDLIAATMEAASAALLAVDDLRRAVASRRAVPGAEIWTDG